MASENYGLLDTASEDAYHKSRLLNVETRPFARIARRLLSSESLIYAPAHSHPAPPADGSAPADEASAREKQAAEREQWRSEMQLDFCALEDSMVRIQLLRRSNAAERERYAAEKVKILDTARLVRANTVELRGRLVEAQKTLAMRKGYDELADRITSNRMLKPRSDQVAAIEKLDKEIEVLEAESASYAATWAERREQFGRILEEGRHMLMLIRDEKEEAERKEGMEGVGEERDGSRLGTPAAEDGSGGVTPLPGSGTEGTGGSTPLRPLPKDQLTPDAASRSPNRSSSTRGRDHTPDPLRSGSVSRGRSPALSQSDALPEREEGEDTYMGEGEADAAERELETGEVDEGEIGDAASTERMDMDMT